MKEFENRVAIVTGTSGIGAAIAKRFPNEPLSAGEIVSTGTLTAGHLTTTGDQWRVEVEGIGLPGLALELA